MTLTDERVAMLARFAIAQVTKEGRDLCSAPPGTAWVVIMKVQPDGSSDILADTETLATVAELTSMSPQELDATIARAGGQPVFFACEEAGETEGLVFQMEQLYPRQEAQG